MMTISLPLKEMNSGNNTHACQWARVLKTTQQLQKILLQKGQRNDEEFQFLFWKKQIKFGVH